MTYRAGLCAIFAVAVVGAAPASAESLLIYRPVTNEVLGNAVLEGDQMVFYDCQDQMHDPTGMEIRATKERCDWGSIYTAAFNAERVLDLQVFQADGTLYGKIDGLTVQDSGRSIELIVKAMDAQLTEYMVPASTIQSWEDLGVKLVLDDDELHPVATLP